MKKEIYIHGYQKDEQERLILQARILEPFLQKRIQLQPKSKVLEIGCGVGAQLRLLIEKYKDVHFTGLDISENNLGVAQNHLSDFLAEGNLDLKRADGKDLPFSNGSFDTVVIFFVLEHVQSPIEVVQEAYRVLKPEGTVYCTEVVNSNVISYPYSDVLFNYWKKFNELQTELGGDPDIGIKLGSLFHEVGFEKIEWNDCSVIMDKRTNSKKIRHELVDNWIRVFLSAHDQLIMRGMVEPGSDEKVRQEFLKLEKDPESVFVYADKQVVARKPEI